MMAIGRPAEAASEIPETTGRFRWLAVVGEFCRKRPLGALGAAVVLVNILVGIGANVIAPYDPLATDYGAMLARPSATHWLGTDAFGRDVLSRIIYGSRTAMLVGFACAFLGEASLTFLGLGVSEPTPAWGLMLRGAAVQFAEAAPWMAIFPGLAISLAVFAFNLFGDSLRDALDPRLRAQ